MLHLQSIDTYFNDIKLQLVNESTVNVIEVTCPKAEVLPLLTALKVNISNVQAKMIERKLDIQLQSGQTVAINKLIS